MNPFEFKHHNLKNISFNVRGELYPRVPYDLNFAENNFHRVYMDYMDAIGIGRSNNSPNITMEAYKKYCAIFALDLQADKCNSEHIHLRFCMKVFLFKIPPNLNFEVNGIASKSRQKMTPS